MRQHGLDSAAMTRPPPIRHPGPMTMTTLDRAETSRRNGAKSRGPKTTEGKQRSKFNAVKHGLTAKTLVLPGEDAELLQLRIQTWTHDRQPASDEERYLIQRAA